MAHETRQFYAAELGWHCPVYIAGELKAVAEEAKRRRLVLEQWQGVYSPLQVEWLPLGAVVFCLHCESELGYAILAAQACGKIETRIARISG